MFVKTAILNLNAIDQNNQAEIKSCFHKTVKNMFLNKHPRLNMTSHQ